MQTKFSPHTSTLGDLKANIVVLIIWLGPALLNFLFPNFGYFGLFIPLFFLLIEKKSELVRLHAGQSLALYLVVNVSVILIGILAGIFGLGGALVGGAIGGTSDTALAAGMLGAGIFGLVIFGVLIAGLIFSIIACVKGWRWEVYPIPVVSKLGFWLTNKIKLK